MKIKSVKELSNEVNSDRDLKSRKVVYADEVNLRMGNAHR
jgi:hypothetical protein